MKDQFVIACIDNEAHARVVLEWAWYMAGRLRHKGLFVLNISAGGDNGWLKELGVPYVGLKSGDWATAIEGLPLRYGGILAVTAVDASAPRTSLANPSNLLRQFSRCKIAYLCVDAAGGECRTDRVTLTLNHRREGKEKLVWASYLARFCGAEITIAHPDYSDQGLRSQLQNNMRFAEKMYAPLGIGIRTEKLDGTTGVDIKALEQTSPDLLVARTTDTRDRDVVDWFMPRPELRLLRHASRTPLLLLNPRDDLYILCD
ncbi:MAG: hypothetical protein IJ760_05050 [Bacteroidales bacterium]|nr:hypothetical protein [Bacteroidales bacterium]